MCTTIRRLRPQASGLALLALLAACSPGPQFNGEQVTGHENLTLAGVNWDGEPFALEQQQGKVVIVFFGYTYCPDVCPLTLAKMKQLYRALESQSDDVAVVFCSVDPHRDTVEKLASYVPNFDRRFYGLHLDFDGLDSVKDAFGLTIQYGQPKSGPGSDSYYYVDHTGSYFIFDQTGRLRLKHPPNASVGDLLPDVQALLAG